MVATEITEAVICDAIADTFREIDGLVVQSYDELTDGIPQTPLLQIYWASFTEDPFQMASQFKVVGSVNRFVMDLYAGQRSELREDIPLVMTWVAKIRKKYYEQTSSIFGLAAIDAISWEGSRTTLTYSDPNLDYAGARFLVNVRIY